MTNFHNFGSVTGRLVHDINADPAAGRQTVFPNSDGSFTVYLNVAVDDNFASGKDKTYKTQFPQFEAYVRDGQNPGIYGLLKKGSKITVGYHIATESFEKNGETNYVTKLKIDQVQFAESKADADAREARKAAQNQQG